MLHYYLRSGNRVLLVDDAEIEMDEQDLALRFEHCRLTNVVRLGSGIYDAIIFPTRPPNGILKKAIEKVRQYIIICGIEEIVKESGCDVLRGSPETLVLRKPLKGEGLC